MLFCEAINIHFQGQMELEVNIYLILSCLRDKSPPIEVNISKFGPKCILALFSSLLILGLIDLDLQFHF